MRDIIKTVKPNLGGHFRGLFWGKYQKFDKFYNSTHTTRFQNKWQSAARLSFKIKYKHE